MCITIHILIAFSYVFIFFYHVQYFLLISINLLLKKTLKVRAGMMELLARWRDMLTGGQNAG